MSERKHVSLSVNVTSALELESAYFNVCCQYFSIRLLLCLVSDAKCLLVTVYVGKCICTSLTEHLNYHECVYVKAFP